MSPPFANGMPVAERVRMTPDLPTIGASFLAGLFGSLHCFGMCGPIACNAAAPPGARQARLAPSATWHVARLSAYALLGGVLGSVGEGAAGLFLVTTSPALPWALALLLMLSATGLLDRLPLPALLSPVRTRLVPLGAGSAPVARASAWGALVAFLPCGLLYGALATALVAGSFVRGALVTLCFGLGAVPALTLAQMQTRWLTRFPASAQFLVRRALPLLSAAVLVWRALHAEPADCCRD
jgi:sulfite exporter TauE/SafE